MVPAKMYRRVNFTKLKHVCKKFNHTSGQIKFGVVDTWLAIKINPHEESAHQWMQIFVLCLYTFSTTYLKENAQTFKVRVCFQEKLTTIVPKYTFDHTHSHVQGSHPMAFLWPSGSFPLNWNLSKMSHPRTRTLSRWMQTNCSNL